MTRPTLPPPPARVSCQKRLEIVALDSVPIIEPGDDLAKVVLDALVANQWTLADNDVIAITSKLLSRAEGRFFDLSTLDVSEDAERLARETGKDPRLVELVLRDTKAVSRKAPNVLVVRHRLGFMSANAGIDASNAVPPNAPAGSGPWALVMPKNPDKTAEAIRVAIVEASGVQVGIVITDSFGRPFRVGTVGVAVGVAGVPAVFDQRGKADLFGRPLESTVTALADQVAAAADLVSGQADEARPITVLRGLKFDIVPSSAAQLLRGSNSDLYA
jgi:coenzyme F420-0:L-glutamate ligase/coenzyme F420-1:gamma-L-glutamate ligase